MELKEISNVWASNTGMVQHNWNQFENERRALEDGKLHTVPHFRVMRDCFDIIGPVDGHQVLEVGAGSGYYKTVLESCGFKLAYTGLDISESARDFATSMNSELDYMMGDATALPLLDNSYDTVISGWVLIHIYDWEKSIQEAARVSRKWVILHRVTTHWGNKHERKEAKVYGASCLMQFFTIADIMVATRSAGLSLRVMLPVSGSGQYINYSFLFEKA